MVAFTEDRSCSKEVTRVDMLAASAPTCPKNSSGSPDACSWGACPYNVSDCGDCPASPSTECWKNTTGPGYNCCTIPATPS